MGNHADNDGMHMPRLPVAQATQRPAWDKQHTTMSARHQPPPQLLGQDIRYWWTSGCSKPGARARCPQLSSELQQANDH